MLTGLVRFVVSLVVLAAFVWFSVTVPLGKRTLWGHVHAIFATQEAKDLVPRPGVLGLQERKDALPGRIDAVQVRLHIVQGV